VAARHIGRGLFVGGELSMLLEGINWKRVERTFDPQLTV
jgi:hypothetical protein